MDTSLIIVLASTVILLLGAKLWQDGNILIQSGKIAQGIVFKNNSKAVGSNLRMYFPVVRFLTDKQEWITKELNIGQNPPIEEGTRLTLIYDPEEPTIVDIKSSFRQEILPRIFVAIGVFGIVMGLLSYIDVLELPSINELLSARNK